MDNQNGRWGQLGEYSSNPVYDVDYRWDSDTEERTLSWLIWDPPEGVPDEERPEEIDWVDHFQQRDWFSPWQGFEVRTIGIESFVPVNSYGLMEERREKQGRILSDMADSFGVELNSATPPAQIQGAKAVRDEARDRLEVHVRRLEEKVMEPLRKIFIACAVETTRAITGFPENPEDVEDEAWKIWADTIQDLDHLFSSGIGRGISSEKLREHWYKETLEHVPDPVAEGVLTALSVYVERSEEKKVDRSRDGILENARSVYFKWEAARRMVWSGLYDWPLQSALREDSPTPSGPGRPSILDNPEEVLETLETVCRWLDENPPKVFRGEGGLVDFATREFSHLTEDGVRDHIRFTFKRLARKHPDLPMPDLTTGTSGREYVESEDEIRALRDEYEKQFVEK